MLQCLLLCMHAHGVHVCMHTYMQSMDSCPQDTNTRQHQEEERQRVGMHAQLHTMLLVWMHTVTTYT